MTRRKFNYWVCLPLLVMAAACSPNVNAQKMDEEAINFVVGSFEFALLHELAHLIISEKEVPVLGPIESAADYIATSILGWSEIRDRDNQELLNSFVLSAAQAFAISWQLSSTRGLDVPYWGVHSLGIQRYYSILCLFYGSDPEKNSGLPEKFGLPEQRIAGCVNEFSLANRGFQWLLDTYGTNTVEEPSNVVLFTYGEPQNLQQRNIIAAIQDINLFEQSVNGVISRFGITEPLKASMRSCGSPQAAWQEGKRELLICYELLDAFYYVYRQIEH